MFFGVYIDIQLNVDFLQTRVIYLVSCFEMQMTIPESVKLILAYFLSAMRYGLILWRNSFRIQEILIHQRVVSGLHLAN